MKKKNKDSALNTIRDWLKNNVKNYKQSSSFCKVRGN